MYFSICMLLHPKTNTTSTYMHEDFKKKNRIIKQKTDISNPYQNNLFNILYRVNMLKTSNNDFYLIE